MPRKTHGQKSEKDPTEALLKQFSELGRRFEEAVGAAVARPEFRQGMEELTTSLRGAAEKIAQAAAAARDSEAGAAFMSQAEKVAKAGKAASADNAAAFAKKLAAGLKTLAAELDGFAAKAKKKNPDS